MTTYDQLIAKGEQIGIQKGEFRNTVKIVINSFQAGLTLETICKISGLSEKEIVEILKNKGLVI